MRSFRLAISLFVIISVYSAQSYAAEADFVAGSDYQSESPVINENFRVLTQRIQVLDGIPSGLIAMWHGSIATIPDGWVLCNGDNGTPDLRDRFVIGATSDDAGVAKTNITGSLTSSGSSVVPSHAHNAGSLTATAASEGIHTHAVGTLSVGNESAHVHSYKGDVASGDLDGNLSAINNKAQLTNSGGGSAHTHSLSGSTAVGSEHTHTISTGGTSATYGTGTEVLPKYYALAYIMKL